jgi:hypothetical protein
MYQIVVSSYIAPTFIKKSWECVCSEKERFKMSHRILTGWRPKKFLNITWPEYLHLCSCSYRNSAKFPCDLRQKPTNQTGVRGRDSLHFSVVHGGPVSSCLHENLEQAPQCLLPLFLGKRVPGWHSRLAQYDPLWQGISIDGNKDKRQAFCWPYHLLGLGTFILVLSLQ